MLPSGCVYVLIYEQIQNQEVPPQLPSIQGTEPQRVKCYYSTPVRLWPKGTQYRVLL